MPENVRHPTEAEIEDRVLMCRRLLSQGRYDGEVKKAVAAHYRCSPRTVERYLRRARDELVAESGKGRDELRAEGYGFYREVRGNANAETRDRLKAQERIDKLLGLEAPTKVDVATGVRVEMTEEIVDGDHPQDDQGTPGAGRLPA
jgi:hypothetical protein